MKEEKVYTAKLGAKFRITDFPKPADGDIVYFTRAEFDYMKSNNFSPELFDGACRIKRGDFRWSPISPEEQETQAELSARLARETIEMLKGRK